MMEILHWLCTVIVVGSLLLFAVTWVAIILGGDERPL